MNRTKQMYEEDREYLDCVEDILEHPVFRSMDQYIQHGETTCKDHCIQVSYRAYQTCRKHGWDWRAAARGGLLHDLFLYDWHVPAKVRGHYLHGFTHPPHGCGKCREILFRFRKRETGHSAAYVASDSGSPGDHGRNGGHVGG